MENNHAIYKAWDLAIPEMTPRSRLYKLEPIGIGTGYVESLTSYVTRLAEAHCVPTGILIMREIAPLVKEGYVFNNKNKYIYDTYPASTSSFITLNETGLLATNLVKAVENLTLHFNLSLLTLLNFSEVFSNESLLKDSKAWCPICYEEWNGAGKTIYEPLIWSLNAITICKHHLHPLITQCPYCHKKNILFSTYSRTGYCNLCKKWLGKTADSSTILSLSSSELDYQLWIIKNISE